MSINIYFLQSMREKANFLGKNNRKILLLNYRLLECRLKH